MTDAPDKPCNVHGRTRCPAWQCNPRPPVSRRSAAMGAGAGLSGTDFGDAVGNVISGVIDAVIDIVTGS